MNVKSKLDETDAVREPKKKYYWLGFGNASPTGDARRGYLGATLWDLHMFDIVLEKMGIKKKVRRRSEGDE